jgi:hypothetical protein
MKNKLTHFQIIMALDTYIITLALGSRLKQRLAKVRAKSEAQDSHFMFTRV